jgi:serine/threonine protein phosphatase 1
MKYYIVTDPHGYYTELEKALREEGFFDETKPHKLVVCGDILDRGSEANKLVDFLLQLKNEDKLIYILGNHEDLLVQCLHKIAGGGVHEIASGMSHHYQNKTWDTLLQISGMDEITAYNNPYALVKEVLYSNFYRELLPYGVDYYETEHYIFTHGWIPCIMRGHRPYLKYEYNPDWRLEESYVWQRARWHNGMELACKHDITEPGKTIVCGHFHTSYGHAVINGQGEEFGPNADYSPFYAEGIIALDACTARSGKVNCIVIEDTPIDI